MYVDEAIFCDVNIDFINVDEAYVCNVNLDITEFGESNIDEASVDEGNVGLLEIFQNVKIVMTLTTQTLTTSTLSQCNLRIFEVVRSMS